LYHDHHGHLHLADKKTPTLDEGIFEAATKWLHNNKGFTTENLAEKPPAELVNEINRVLSMAVKEGLTSGIKHEIPQALTEALNKNVFVFSGLKAYHELKQASTMLIDENGGIVSYEKFKLEMLKLNDTYNLNYLNTEYNFATQTAQMAAKWNDIEQDGDEYWLQFRTSADEKVRASHAELHNTTLPPSDPFWDSYMPPLDWNCRCTVVQVLADKYAKSNSTQAVGKGETATTRIDKKGVNRAAMFRFNPGKQRVIFPQNHPYFKVQQGVKEVVEALYNSSSEKSNTAKEIVTWYKGNMPKTKAGKFEAKRFEVMRADLDSPIIINKNFYNELVGKYKDDKHYVERLQLSKQAHILIKDATYSHDETPVHAKADMFKVYTKQHDGRELEFKCKVNNDGIFLYYMRIK